MSSQAKNNSASVMDPVSDLHKYLDTFSEAVSTADTSSDNPVDDWAEHMERQAESQDKARRKSEELSSAGTATGDSGDVLELHPEDEPMDVTPVEPEEGVSGASCVWRLEEDLSNLPAVGSPLPRQIKFNGRTMSCPDRIELAVAYARQHRLLPRRFFTKSLSFLQGGKAIEHPGQKPGKESKEKGKSLGTQPTPVSGPGPKPRDLQARASAPILVKKPKGPAKGKKVKRNSNPSKPLPEAQAKGEQPRAAHPQPVAKELVKARQLPTAKPPAPKVVEPPKKGAKRKGEPAPTPKNLAPKLGRLEPVAENPLATMALTQLSKTQAMVADLQFKLDRATRSETRLSVQLERANMDVRALLGFIRDNGLRPPPTYSTR